MERVPSRGEQIGDQPRSGCIAPEYQRDSVREIFEGGVIVSQATLALFRNPTQVQTFTRQPLLAMRPRRRPAHRARQHAGAPFGAAARGLSALKKNPCACHRGSSVRICAEAPEQSGAFFVFPSFHFFPNTRSSRVAPPQFFVASRIEGAWSLDTPARFALRLLGVNGGVSGL